MSRKFFTPVRLGSRLGRRLHAAVQWASAAAILDGWVPLWLVVDLEIHDTLMREHHAGYDVAYADWRRLCGYGVSVEPGLGWRLVVGPGPVEDHKVMWAKGLVG